MRAELNLILRERRFAVESKRGIASSIKTLIVALISSGSGIFSAASWLHGQRSTLVNGVSFKEVLTTIAFWRCPALIPEFLRRERQKRIQNIVLMACGLTVSDFLRAGAAGSGRRRILSRMSSEASDTSKLPEIAQTRQSSKSAVTDCVVVSTPIATNVVESGCKLLAALGCDSNERITSSGVDELRAAVRVTLTEAGCLETYSQGFLMHPAFRLGAVTSPKLLAEHEEGPTPRCTPGSLSGNGGTQRLLPSDPGSERTLGKTQGVRRLAALSPLVPCGALPQAHAQDCGIVRKGSSASAQHPRDAAAYSSGTGTACYKRESLYAVKRRPLQALPISIQAWRGLEWLPATQDGLCEPTQAQKPSGARRFLRPLPISPASDRAASCIKHGKGNLIKLKAND